MKLETHSQRDDVIVQTGFAWLDGALNGGFRRGGCYLLSGSPGANKTTLAVQAAAKLAMKGMKILLVLSEQQPADLYGILQRVLGVGESSIPKRILQNIDCEILESTGDLLRVLRRTLPARYPGTQLIIIDSLQGNGLPGSASRAYRDIFSFFDEAKARDLITIAVAHITKAGQIAGPKSLEHKIDAAIVLRKSHKFRHMFVLKNRYGAEVVDPVVLSMNGKGLERCPHAAAQCASALGYSGTNDELAEIQVAVSIPRLGGRSELNAPFLPRQRIKQLVTSIAKLPHIDLNELSYAINCLVPNTSTYRCELDLPIVISMLSAYLQQPVPAGALFIGQIDLRLNIRPPCNTYMSALTQVLSYETYGVDQVYLSTGAATVLTELTPAGVHYAFEIVPVRTLAELLAKIWPDEFDHQSADKKRLAAIA